MFAPGMFVNSAGTTPEEIARKRAEIAAMMPRFGNARYVGEGLGQLFSGIGLGRQQAALDKQEQAGRQSADERLRSVMGMRGTAGPGSFTVLGPMPAANPNSPEGIASDTMAALGKAPTADTIRDGLIARGMPPHIAEGFVMNMQDESGLNPGINEVSPLIPGSRGGFGLSQWTGPRRVALEEYAAAQGKPVDDWNLQLDFLMQELQGPEAAAWSKISQAQDPGSAAAAIATDFLRPAQEHLDRRVAQYTGGNSPQAMAAGIPTQDLMALASDPWQPAEVRAQAQAMLDQQMKLNDPAYTMGLEADRLAIQKAQMELAQMGQPETPEALLERQALASAAGLQPGTPEYQTYMLTGNLTGPGQGNEYGLQPIYGTDAQGNVVVMQLGKDGTAVQTALPEGVTPDLAVKAAETARGTILGKAEGEAVTGLSDAVAKAQQAVALIDQISEDPALVDITGMVLGSMWPSIGGGQAGVDLNVKIEQLQGKVFLEAFEALKGGGAITEIEGAKAEQAIARLNRAQSTKAYKEALDEVKSIISSGMIRAQERAAKAGGNTGGTTGGKTRLRFNPETGVLEPVQ